MRQILLRLTIGMVITPLLAGGFWPAFSRSVSHSNGPPSPKAERLLTAESHAPQFSRIEKNGPLSPRGTLHAAADFDGILSAASRCDGCSASLTQNGPTSLHRPAAHLRL